MLARECMVGLRAIRPLNVAACGERNGELGAAEFPDVVAEESERRGESSRLGGKGSECFGVGFARVELKPDVTVRRRFVNDEDFCGLPMTDISG